MAQATHQIPEKYAKLKQAEAAGVAVPMSLLLDFNESALVTQYAIDSFVECLPYRRLIVRSAHLFEDGSDFSLAGHFWSSGPVAEAQLFATIQQAQKENAVILKSLQLNESATENPPKLVLQEYIEHEIGGVLFSPWSFFPDYSYVEYSAEGVKNVVEGGNSISAVLSLDEHCSDPLALPERQEYLKQQLVELCQQLLEIYDFPIDCEWAYEQQKQRVVVLQIRPQTHSVGPVLPYSAFRADNKAHDSVAKKLDSQFEDTHLQNTVNISPNWQFTALSESLGRLSPLSFSLLKQLYSDAIPLFRLLGCKAIDADFIAMTPDGTVLVDPSLETQFYAMRLFGGFQRGKQQAKLVPEASALLKQYDSSASFSYDTLQQLFAYWMGTNLLTGGAGRSQPAAGIFADPAHAYELSWPAVLEPPVLTMSLDSLEAINSWGRVLFLFELNKLKRQLKQTGRVISGKQLLENSDIARNKAYVHFCGWSELQARNFDEAGAETRSHETGLGLYESAKIDQHMRARMAIYDFALTDTEGSDGLRILSSTKLVEGVLQIITNPASAKQAIQADRILVAPYFDNRWIGQLKLLKGIVVARGSRLSHSAIVAREHAVPYYVVPELNLKKMDQGQRIVLDPNTVTSLFR